MDMTSMDHSAMHHGMHMAQMDQDDDGVLPFCNKGMGAMVMFMDGFRWGLQGNQPCLNLLFPTWTLDTKEKFYFAIFGVFVMAMFVEGFSKLRHRVVRAAKNRATSRPTRVSLLWCVTSLLLRGAVTVLHGTQALLGYTLMLVTMTFSIELLLSVVAGLATGYAVFFQSSSFAAGDWDDDVASSGTGNEDGHVTSNPCCDFMTEESREVDAQRARSTTTRRRGRGSANSPLMDPLLVVAGDSA